MHTLDRQARLLRLDLDRQAGCLVGAAPGADFLQSQQTVITDYNYKTPCIE